MTDRYKMRDDAIKATEALFKRTLTFEEQRIVSFVVGYVQGKKDAAEMKAQPPLYVHGQMPEDEMVRTKMQTAALLVDSLFNEPGNDTVGWVLMAVPVETGMVGFVGNGSPSTMLDVLKAALKKLQAQSQHAPGHA